MKQTIRMLVGFGLLAGILAFSLYGIGSSIASGDYQGRYGDDDDFYRMLPNRNAGSEYSEAYRQACAECHMAYPVGLLPARSWRRIMANLEDHFGESAELDDATHQQVSGYLARVSNRYGSRRWPRHDPAYVPMRITELPYFRHEHDEIPARLLADNDRVLAISQCDACHRGAEQGYFDEDSVVIPGFGRWDD